MNPYEVLDVSRDATEDEIIKAYRRRAAEFHPDKPTGNEVRFHEAKKACDLLTDPDARSVYDTTGIIVGEDRLADSAMVLIAKTMVEIAAADPYADMAKLAVQRVKVMRSELENMSRRLENAADKITTRMIGNDQLSRFVAATMRGRVKEQRDQLTIVNKAIEILQEVRYTWT